MTNINTDLKGFLSLPPVSGAKKKGTSENLPLFFLNPEGKKSNKTPVFSPEGWQSQRKVGEKSFFGVANQTHNLARARAIPGFYQDNSIAGSKWALDLADSLDLGGSSLPAISISLPSAGLNFKEKGKSSAQTIRLIGGRMVTLATPGKNSPATQAKLNNLGPNMRDITEFQNQFKTKQKVKHLYGGLSEGWVKKLALASPSNLISLLETRLDVVVFRLHWANSIRKAQKLIKSGLIVVDNQIIRHPSHLVKIGNAITLSSNLNPKSINRRESVFTSQFKHIFNFPAGDSSSLSSAQKTAILIKYPQQSTLLLPSTLSLKKFKCAMNKYIGF
jgi:ribosomal protein S4